jgi:hypothetical protein
MSIPGGFFVALRSSTSIYAAAPLPAPTLVLDFIANTYSVNGASRTFNEVIEFSRTTSATFIGSNGLVQTASPNLLLWTQEFNDATWAKTNTTVAANSIAAPDGTTTADTLTATAANATTLQTFTATNVPYMYSVWLRRLTGTGNIQITVDGTTYATVAVTSTWTRFNTLLMGLAGSRTAGVRIVTSGDAIYAWGAQLEAVPETNLTLGSELISSGVTGIVGTATAATYNTTTGAGSVDRVDLSNQSFVQWSGLTGNYLANITHNSGVGVGIRTGGHTGDAYMTITGNSNRTGYLPATSNLITITSSSGAVTFTLNSFRQITGTTGMPSAYKINTGSVVFPPRFDHNPSTLQPRGLLIEEQRTNALLHSSDLTQTVWVKTNATAAKNATGPDGVAYSATIITATASNATVLQAVTAVSTQRNSSCYIKRRTGTGTVEITQNGGTTWTAVTVTSGWTRVATPGASITNPSVGLRIVTSGDAVDVAFFQCEDAGILASLNAPTSVIPTGASQVTRTADVARITGANFLSWYNLTESTMVAEFSGLTPNNNSRFAYAISNGSNFNEWSTSGSGGGFNHSVFATSFQASVTFGTYSANTVFKSAFGVRLNSVQAAVNGVLGTEDTTVILPTVDQLAIGVSPVGSTGFLIGHLRSLTYYPARGTNLQLQALSI